MSKEKVYATYRIKLERHLPDYPDESSWWTWLVYFNEDLAAVGTGSYRWSALRKAKKAARRDLKGLVPVKVKVPRSNTVLYPISAKR